MNFKAIYFSCMDDHFEHLLSFSAFPILHLPSHNLCPSPLVSIPPLLLLLIFPSGLLCRNADRDSAGVHHLDDGRRGEFFRDLRLQVTPSQDKREPASSQPFHER